MARTTSQSELPARRVAAANLYALVIRDLVADFSGDHDYDLPASWHEYDLTQFPGLSVSPDMGIEEWLEQLTEYLNLSDDVVQRDLYANDGRLEGVEQILKNGF